MPFVDVDENVYSVGGGTATIAFTVIPAAFWMVFGAKIGVLVALTVPPPPDNTVYAPADKLPEAVPAVTYTGCVNTKAFEYDAVDVLPPEPVSPVADRASGIILPSAPAVNVNWVGWGIDATVTPGILQRESSNPCIDTICPGTNP